MCYLWLPLYYTVGSSGCDRDHMAHKPKILNLWPFFRKCLLAPGLNHQSQATVAFASHHPHSWIQADWVAAIWSVGAESAWRVSYPLKALAWKLHPWLPLGRSLARSSDMASVTKNEGSIFLLFPEVRIFSEEHCSLQIANWESFKFWILLFSMKEIGKIENFIFLKIFSSKITSFN